MRKIMHLDGKLEGLKYVYRIASVSVDKVTLEKHSINVKNTFEDIVTTRDFKKTILVFEIDDDTRVGTVTQKMAGSIINDISKKVDEVAVDFLMEDKVISLIEFNGVVNAP